MYGPRAAQRVYAMRFVLLVAPLVLAGAWAVVAPASQTLPTMVCGVLAAAACSIVPRLYVLWKRRQRKQSIGRALPDAMDMLSMCVGGGMPLSPALSYVAGKMPNSTELAGELTLLKRQMEVGGLQLACSDFAARVQIPEARQLGSLLTRGEKLGSQLSRSLYNQADRMRETRRQAAIRQANKTPAKLVLPMLLLLRPGGPAAANLARHDGTDRIHLSGKQE